jgi:tRNA (cmo5U34)-methyltransferase
MSEARQDQFADTSKTKVRDNLFSIPDAPAAGSFEFGRSVVRVFDDMVSRSVPLYEVIQELMAIILLRCRAPGPICDLGCSTGATLSALIGQATEPLDLIGIDQSPDMLDACRSKLAPLLGSHRLTLCCASLEALPDGIGGEWGAVVLSLVAQFLRPLARQKLLADAARRLRPGGCLVLLEKTVQRSLAINKTFIDCYHDYKSARGYSMTEIARKREALENRLIPFRPEENVAMLREAGFAEAEIFFTWLNFQGYLAVKAAGS